MRTTTFITLRMKSVVGIEKDLKFAASELYQLHRHIVNETVIHSTCTYKFLNVYEDADVIFIT